MSVVGLTGPVAAGKALTYEIEVTNKGSIAYQQVSLTATVPEGMAFDPIGTSPPKFAREGDMVRFNPVFEIKPGESLMYRVRVRAKQPGTFQFRAELSTPALLQPIRQETSTEVNPPREG